MPLRRRTVLALLGLTLAACARGRDPVADDIASAMERTTPPGGRLIRADRLHRDGGLGHASWSIETAMSWDSYAPWVETRLTGYRLAQRDAERLQFDRQLDGDAYGLMLVRGTSSRILTIEASFQATPF